MTKMSIARSFPAVLLGVLVLFPGTAAAHDPDLSKHEFLCEQRTTFRIATFMRRYVRCARNCDGDPGCIAASCSSREAVVRNNQGSCTTDCPDCYNNGDCTAAADARVMRLRNQLDGLITQIYCDDSGSGDGLNHDEAKCQRDLAGRAASFFSRKWMNCIKVCRNSEDRNDTPPGSCDTPLTTNPNANTRAEACVMSEESRVIEQIDDSCEPTGGDRPECYGSRDGAAWTTDMEAIVDGEDPHVHCGSPSGAFLGCEGGY